MWVPKQLTVAIYFHSIFFFHTMKVNVYQQLFGCNILFIFIFFDFLFIKHVKCITIYCRPWDLAIKNKGVGGNLQIIQYYKTISSKCIWHPSKPSWGRSIKPHFQNNLFSSSKSSRQNHFLIDRQWQWWILQQEKQWILMDLSLQKIRQ